MKKIIHWFRRDLRVHDNTALHEAARRGAEVIPVFILEEALSSGVDVGAVRLAFLLQSVEALRVELEKLGYRLLIRSGKSDELIPALCRETGASAVFCNKRYEPYTVRRDERIAATLATMGVEFHRYKDAVIWEEREILTQGGTPYTVFTPYSRAWKSRSVPAPSPALARNSKQAKAYPSDPLPLDPAAFGHALKHSVTTGGEAEALKMWHTFLAGPIHQYEERRNFPAIHGTSMLSPHLRCGNIGIRRMVVDVLKARAAANPVQAKNCDVFLSELIWREFYAQILSNFPHVMRHTFRREYDAMVWSDNEAHFQAWCAGQTGYPIVDAAMRCLNQTGWMHNRLRMIVAMFLTKDLMLHWQKGERYFMQQLSDGDMAANNGGWQWSSGTGTDAAPYFRIFNPTTQGQKFDPEGVFIRQWVPELVSLDNEMIHEPWETPLIASRLKYTRKVVLHEEQRPKCLAMYAAVKGAKAEEA